MTTPTPAPRNDVATALERLADSANELGDDVRASNAERRRGTRWMLAALAVIAVAVLAVAALGLQNRVLNQQNAEIIQKVRDTNQYIADCTIAGGECYKRGRKSQGEAIADIIGGSLRGSIAAMLCQQEGKANTIDEIEACALRKLAAAASTAKPTPSPAVSTPATGG